MDNFASETWINFNNINTIISGINARGFASHREEMDDYRKLLAMKEFSELVAYELYETYFYADRHEFDLLLIEEIVKSVVEFFTSPEVINANTTLLQHLVQSIPALIVVQICEHIKENFQINSNRNIKYNEICQNIKSIQKYFRKNLYLDTKDIKKIFDESPSRIIPLLKLLGCKHYVTDDGDFWLSPADRREEDE